MRDIRTMSSDELIHTYSIVLEQYNLAYKAKKEIEEEMHERSRIFRERGGKKNE